MAEQGQSQYAAVASVPLIKSPSLRVPPPIQLPPDIHPLPDDVTAYFVYPFTLEPHIVTLESSRQATLAAHEARRQAYLQQREDEKERRKRDALRRIAPGFEPQGAPLVPVKIERPLSGSASAQPFYGSGSVQSATASQFVMDDLVDQLVAMDARTTKSVVQIAPTTNIEPTSSFFDSSQQH